MRESPLYQEILDEGEQNGYRKSLFGVLEARFGLDVAREFEEPLKHVQNLEQLYALIKLASQSRRISQFRRAFPKS